MRTLSRQFCRVPSDIFKYNGVPVVPVIEEEGEESVDPDGGDKLTRLHKLRILHLNMQVACIIIIMFLSSYPDIETCADDLTDIVVSDEIMC